MGAAREAAEGIIAAFNARDLDGVYEWLAEDFEFVNPNSPIPSLNADQWLGINQQTFDAFSDLKFNFEIIDEEGDQVWVRTRITGTHDGDWDMTAMGRGVVPATGIRVAAEEEVTVGVVNADGLVEVIEIVESGPDTGFAGVMKQIGLEVG